MLRTKKLYSKVRAIFEDYGDEETFQAFLHNLCDINVITVHQAAKLLKMERKNAPKKSTVPADLVNDIAFDIMHADDPEVSYSLAKGLYDLTVKEDSK